MEGLMAMLLELAGVVAGAVDHEIVLVVAPADGEARAQASGGCPSRRANASGAGGRARHQDDELGKVTTVEGNLGGIAVVDHLADHRVFRLQHHRSARYGDRLGDLAHFERQVDACLLVQLQPTPVSVLRLKPATSADTA